MVMWSTQILPGRLDTELVVHVSNVEPLAVDSAETDGPLGRVPPGQLGDVLGGLPCHVGGALVVDTLDIKTELVKLRYDQLAPECLRDQDVAFLQKPKFSQ